MGTLFIIILVLLIIFIIIYAITKQEQKKGELVDIDDIVAGYEFNADLWASTSLEALNHHGVKVSHTPENELQDFGDGKRSHGVWLPFSHDMQTKQPTKAELIELEFLKKFRKAYESDLSHDQKYEIISSLFEEYNDLPSKLHATDWYLWDLMEIPGMSTSISEVLHFEGIKSKQDVKMASDKELLNIPGIGNNRLRQIRAYFSKDTTNRLSKTKDENYKKKTTEPIEIDISRAQKIHLPKLKYERSPDPADSVKQDWDEYNSITRNAQFHYNTKRYQKAKEEWLKIYNWYHRDEKYYTHLLKTYRKLIDTEIKKKRYNETLMYLNEFFEKCSNHTNTDIKNYNHVVSQLNKLNQDTKLPLKELISIVEPDFCIDSKEIALIQESKKPRGFKFEFSGDTSVLELKSLSDFLPVSLPHIQFDNKSIRYKEINSIPSILNNTYRFRESSNLDAFLSSSKELKIHFYNWNFELLGIFDATSYAESHTHLRRIELSSDLSYFLFTIVDKAYFLDSKMNLISIWQVPYKEGFEKRKVEGSTGENTQVKECLKILYLPDKPTKEEIKLAFRKLVIKWHPDRNPNNPEAEERTRQLIQAYEFLSGEDAQRAFDGINKEDYYWVDLSRITKVEVEGMTFELILSIGSGEDWIYGAGLSDDGARIYLGCYSGKIYQINQDGIAEKIYIVPEDKKGDYGMTNPISFVTEYNDRKYILTHWYLYILKDDKLFRYLKIEKGNYKWFKNGFIHQDKKQIVLFDRDGDKKGMLSFKSPILQVCYKDNILLVESTTKVFTFKVNYN